MKQQRGSVALNILLVIMLIIIGVLIYLLARGDKVQTGQTFGINSPGAVQSGDAQNRPVTKVAAEFTDGLGAPNSSFGADLDEMGVGIASTDIFDRDINGDGRPDRITRTRVENGTSHYYYEYKIELNNGAQYIDITPPDFRTVEGADCALKKIQFIFEPDFAAIVISRPWRDTWTTPTRATKTTYAISGGQMNISNATQMKTICDVSQLFE